jgi:chaperonin GroEL
MQPKDKIKEVTFADPAHLEITKGVEIMRQAVGSTYGPGGRNVLIKKQYVQPILTRDGVTVARDIAGHGNRLQSSIATEAAKLVYQASEKTNKTAGDGTTATVVELADLYMEGRRLIAAGADAMEIKRTLDRSRDIISDFVKSKSKPADKPILRQVAEVSCGDAALAEMLSDLVWDVGANGAITISYHNAPYVEVEKVTGYMFTQGFRHLSMEIEYTNPLVFVSQKRIATKAEIIPILGIAEQSQRQIVIVADVTGAAADTLLWAISNNKIDGLAIPPPAFGADGHDWFEDIAIYTGARLWLESDDFEHVTLDSFGEVKGARISRDRAVLFGDGDREVNGVSVGNAIAERIAQIENQKAQTDASPALIETYELRIARLGGKVSIVKVGAPTEVEREELFFRVEDAVEACKSAIEMGIVAGGATTLLFASVEEIGKIRSKPDYALEKFVRDALQAPFGLLMSNAGEDGGYRKNQVLNAGYGKGFNLRNMSDEPVDLYKSGIVDATKVVLQVVKNSFSIAAALLTTGTVITEVENETPESVSQA